ncbi:mitochondrial FAD-dependent oxidoreductase [Andalucia godoyi]|uniref:Mitochondrial FAD-dependent oxidoreductase n=1 Tax=Andalucia godoyi TaxID=505711 RepID=A0A8K0AGB1_ANDGO|nr:mitochondrial FAD-dependent oxidoreductase [Andalucia godoyi]|eukprot:ANDGO_06164.mRNA.1 mitochondrial FAD-dependent oxidoreductase
MRLAIVGAGVSGLSAAYALRASKSVTQIEVFEKSRGFSGRAATRRKNGASYDHGANYFYSEDPLIRDIILNQLPTDGLVVISKPVFVFGESGEITPGDLERDRGEKWVYQPGISQIGKLLVAAVPAERIKVHFEKRVASLERAERSARWTLVTTTGDRFGDFDGVLVTAPAPQAAGLVCSGSVESWAEAGSIKQALGAELALGTYNTQITFVLGYDKKLTSELPYYAAVNTDRKHDIAWLSVEDDKEGHVAGGNSVLIVQMASHWSTANYEHSLEDLLPSVTNKVSVLLAGDQWKSPSWSDVQKWRFALPNSRIDTSRGIFATSAAQHGLFFTGDYTAERGRVTLAMAAGLQVASKIEEFAK